MPSEFTRRPRHLRGALVAYQSHIIPGVPRVVTFQYNPETVTRRLQARTQYERSRSLTPQPPHMAGPPRQSVSMSVALDAADQLEAPAENPDIVAFGLHPALATLEMLLYPSSASIIAGVTAAALGSQATVPPDIPLVLLVWGPARVVPAHLTSFSVNEQAFDQLLNPIRAEVQMDLDILTSFDLEAGTLGHGVALAHHVTKEVLSAAHQVRTAIEIGTAPF